MHIFSRISKQSKLIALIELILVYGFVFNPWTVFPITFIIIICAIFLFSIWHNKTLSDTGLKTITSSFKSIGIAIALFFILEPVLDFIIQPIVNNLTGDEVDYSAFQSLAHNFYKYSKYVVYILISASFGEELLFRGFFFNQLKLILPEFKFKTLVISILSSICFSLPHIYQGTSGLIMTFIIGMFFALIYVRTNNLWASITLHALVDIMFLTLAYFDKLDYYLFANEVFFGGV